MPKRDLTPTQARVLADLAAGGTLVYSSRSGRAVVWPPRGEAYPLRRSTFLRLLTLEVVMVGRMRLYPPNATEYNLTPAGRDRAAQPAGATRAPAQEKHP